MTSGFKFGVFGVVVLVLIALGVMAFPFVNVDAGERGVVLRWGAAVDTIGPGLHMLRPLSDKAITMDVRTQKEQAEASAASLDLQTVNTTIAVNYSVDPEKVLDLYTRVGTDYKVRVIDPAIQEVVKAATARYNATDLLAKRGIVSDEIRTGLVTRLSPYDITVTDVSVVNFSFSKAFNEAIEAKVTAAQNALASENNLRAAQFDAQSIKVKSEAANNEKYIQLQTLEVERAAVEKWNGQLPNQMIPGQTLPFLNLISSGR